MATLTTHHDKQRPLQFQKIQRPQWKGVTSETTGQVSFSFKAAAISVNVTPILPRRVVSARLPDAVSRMSPRLRLNWGGSRGTLRTSVYLTTYCAFERIDELACVVALLESSPLENSSPVHPAIAFARESQRMAETPSFNSSRCHPVASFGVAGCTSQRHDLPLARLRL